MALFDPANMVAGLLKNLGVSPDAIMGLAQQIALELQTFRNDKAAFQQAGAATVAEFRSRLDRIETKLDRLLSDQPTHTLTIEQEHSHHV